MLLSNYMGIVSLNENESKIKSLTIHRPLASIPIFGRYRIIDFILSNFVNAGISNVGIFTNSNSRSLVDHLGTGKPWNLNRKVDGLFVFNHFLDNPNVSDMKLLKNNMEYLFRSKKDMVIFASSQMLCNINLNQAAEFHQESGADVTIVYKQISQNDEMFLDCYTLKVNKNEVVSIGKNVGMNNSLNISMDMFIMSKDFLIKSILNCLEDGTCTTFKEFIYKNFSKFRTYAYEFNGYLSCVNSIYAYYKTSMDILNHEIRKELFFKNGPIFTKPNDSPPTEYFSTAEIENSIISSGCIIKGSVKNSIVSRSVVIEEDAVVEDSIIFPKCSIEKGAYIQNVILDKNVVIDKGIKLIGDKKYPLVMEKRLMFSINNK